MCVCVCVRERERERERGSMCVCIVHIVMLELLLMCALCVSFCSITHSIHHLDVHHVCYVMFAQSFEPGDRRFTNIHYYSIREKNLKQEWLLVLKQGPTHKRLKNKNKNAIY